MPSYIPLFKSLGRPYPFHIVSMFSTSAKKKADAKFEFKLLKINGKMKKKNCFSQNKSLLPNFFMKIKIDIKLVMSSRLMIAKMLLFLLGNKNSSSYFAGGASSPSPQIALILNNTLTE
jgi:hypothetical protein